MVSFFEADKRMQTGRKSTCRECVAFRRKALRRGAIRTSHHWFKAKVLIYLRDLYEQCGQSPTFWMTRRAGGPSSTVYKRLFGGFNAAKRAAELPVNYLSAIPGQISCRVCGQQKNDSEFRRDSKLPTGLTRLCLKCQREKNKALRTRAFPFKSLRASQSFLLRNAPLKLRFQVLSRDQFRCGYCGASAANGSRLEVDHKVPWSAGGATVLENLITACQNCNKGKSSMLLDFEQALLSSVKGRADGHVEADSVYPPQMSVLEDE